MIFIKLYAEKYLKQYSLHLELLCQACGYLWIVLMAFYNNIQGFAKNFLLETKPVLLINC